jgi:hypothetical protein
MPLILAPPPPLILPAPAVLRTDEVRVAGFLKSHGWTKRNRYLAHALQAGHLAPQQILAVLDRLNVDPVTASFMVTHLVGFGVDNGFAATGGNTITEAGGFRIHTFTSDGTFTPNQAGTVEYLVVAGGAGGGIQEGNQNGGGGAGALRTATGFAVLPTGLTVTVGAGGAIDAAGNDSVFSTITSTGGGRGATRTTHAAGNGGSGGGGAEGPNATGGTGTTGGNNGGDGVANAGAGGGGAGAVGSNGTGAVAGNGGAGTASSISGASVTYAGGGGGGAASTHTQSSGGAGGGGAGAKQGVGAATAGTANTGGGGGGSATGQNAAAGGSGIVIIRYLS